MQIKWHIKDTSQNSVSRNKENVNVEEFCVVAWGWEHLKGPKQIILPFVEINLLAYSNVYCENRSIGWNNTVTDDNVPERDDLWSSFGITDSGGFMCLPRQLQSPLLCWCHIRFFTPPTRDCSSFYLLVSQQSFLAHRSPASFLLLTLPHL